MNTWYKRYSKYRLEDNPKSPYKVMKVVEDKLVPISGYEDIRIDAYSPSQARFLFLKKYPALQDYLSIGNDIEVRLDMELAKQRKEEYEQSMREMDETVQNAWWNND